MPDPYGIIVYVTIGEQETQDIVVARAPEPVRATAAPATRSRRRRSVSVGPDRVFLISMGLILLGLLAILPVSMKVDSVMDRKRPMYSDVEWMAWMEYHHVLHQGVPRPVRAGAGQTVTLGGLQHTLSPGVSARIRVEKHSYCVRARNQYGDVTERVCYRDKVKPPDPTHATT